VRILAVDVGGTHVKLLVNGKSSRRRFPSGPRLTPEEMVAGVRRLAEGWRYDVVSVGYPGPVVRGRPAAEPHNLGRGWVDFDFEAAFGCPVAIVNDAAMQALGSYRRGVLLFLGLGTGLGSAMVAGGMLLPMELAHLPYRGGTYEEAVGQAALKRKGKKRWRRRVADVVGRLVTALQPDDVVLGGGNVKKLGALPPGWRQGSNDNAFLGGFRLWDSRGESPFRWRLPRPPGSTPRRRRAARTGR
jgi:polyphosphate glucokinase